MNSQIQRIVLYGTGSPLIVDYLETCERLNIVVNCCVQNVEGACFVDDGDKVLVPSGLGERRLAYPATVPLFTPGNRYFATQEAKRLGFVIAPQLIDPTSAIASTTSIGLGSYINSGVSIGGAGQLGAGVLINRGATLGHHALLSCYVSIGPGASIAGQVKIGVGSVVATGAVVLPKVTIGNNAVVGAGAVVIDDVEDNTLVVGNPARIVRRDIPGFNKKSVPTNAC